MFLILPLHKRQRRKQQLDFCLLAAAHTRTKLKWLLEPQGTSVLQTAAEHVNVHSQQDGLTQSRYSTMSSSVGKLVSNTQMTLGTHFFHYFNPILKFPLMKCLAGKQWRCRSVLALRYLNMAQQEILTRQTVGKGTPIVSHTLHTGNNKIKTKHVRKVVLWEGVCQSPHTLSTEYYTNPAVTLHPKYTILYKHPEEICSDSPWPSWGLSAGVLHKLVMNAEPYLLSMNPKLLSNSQTSNSQR